MVDEEIIESVTEPTTSVSSMVVKEIKNGIVYSQATHMPGSSTSNKIILYSHI